MSKKKTILAGLTAASLLIISAQAGATFQLNPATGNSISINGSGSCGSGSCGGGSCGKDKKKPKDCKEDDKRPECKTDDK